MSRAVTLVLALILLSAGSRSFAFVDQIAVSPAAPHAAEPITISFRSGMCDGVSAPLVWELQGNGTTRELIVNGLSDLEPLFCQLATETTTITIGALPPGNYTVGISFRDILDGLGGIPNPVGSAQFTVGQEQPIPTLNLLGLGMIAVLLLGVVAFGRRSIPAAEFTNPLVERNQTK